LGKGRINAMGFFAEFMGWLNRILEGYISGTTATIAAVLEPAIVTLSALYIVVWGYLHLMGQIQEPFVTGVKRLFVLATVLGVSLSLWYYNEIFVNTFFAAPSALAARIVGSQDPVAVVDGVLAVGNEVATALTRRAILSVVKPPFYVAAFFVQIIIVVTC
jgi:type IV secretion system protein VirB6